MSTTYEETLKELVDLFEEYWKTAPVFPIPSEHELHKLVAKAAFMSGYLEGIKTKLP